MNTPEPFPHGGEKRVLVAMSGGVDSSVCALLIREAGYEAFGVTLDLFCGEGGENNKRSEVFQSQPEEAAVCCSKEAIREAYQVCCEMGISHQVLECADLFSRKVIDTFCDAYLCGKTPNPCIDCNRFIKFEVLQTYRQELGYDYIATGHYARCCHDPCTGKYLLKRGIDQAKDQSYVLFRLTQDHLAHLLFPLGELTKPEVREIARKSGFHNAERKESQDICFIPDGDHSAFIKRHRSVEFTPGPIVDRSGKVLGIHTGLANYTIGQRKGLGIAAAEPLYVYAKDPATNTIVVGTDAQTLCRCIVVCDVNFISGDDSAMPFHAAVKTRYQQNPQRATITRTGDDMLNIVFDAPQRACASGQAAVIYDGDIVIGGGTICRSLTL